jgi:hypothetical protein
MVDRLLYGVPGGRGITVAEEGDKSRLEDGDGNDADGHGQNHVTSVLVQRQLTKGTAAW